jgi:predicted PhzF superfamily epimerase YddE/YHI9
MAAFARWTNLSETTFLLPPTEPVPTTACASSRPAASCPLPATPRWAAATPGWPPAAAAQPGRQVVQQCGVGLVRVRRDGTRLAFAAPPLRRSGPLEPAAAGSASPRHGAAARGDIVQHQWVDNGPGWCAVMLARRARCARCARLGALGDSSSAWWARRPPGATPPSRCAPSRPRRRGPEDPVTGSLNAGLAQWLIGAGLAPPRYVAAQGHALGRAGRVHVQQRRATRSGSAATWWPASKAR